MKRGKNVHMVCSPPSSPCMSDSFKRREKMWNAEAAAMPFTVIAYSILTNWHINVRFVCRPRSQQSQLLVWSTANKISTYADMSNSWILSSFIDRESEAQWNGLLFVSHTTSTDETQLFWKSSGHKLVGAGGKRCSDGRGTFPPWWKLIKATEAAATYAFPS